MSKPEQLRKHALECLRLESDCMQLAADASNQELRSHFLRRAQHWATLAVSGPSAEVGQALATGKARTT